MSVPPPPPPYNPGGVPMPPQYPNVPPGYQQYAPSPGMGYYGGQPAYASFGARLGAFIIDYLIGALFGVPGWLILRNGSHELRKCPGNSTDYCSWPTGRTWAIGGAIALLGSVIFLIIFCRMLAKGQSIGMKATSIRIVRAEDGQNISAWRALGWYFAHILSWVVCLLGFFWMLWDQRKQTWHDKIASTYVVKA